MNYKKNIIEMISAKKRPGIRALLKMLPFLIFFSSLSGIKSHFGTKQANDPVGFNHKNVTEIGIT